MGIFRNYIKYTIIDQFQIIIQCIYLIKLTLNEIIIVKFRLDILF